MAGRHKFDGVDQDGKLTTHYAAKISMTKPAPRSPDPTATAARAAKNPMLVTHWPSTKVVESASDTLVHTPSTASPPPLPRRARLID